MYKLIKPFLFRIEPEKAHGLTIDALKTLQKLPALFPIVNKLFTYRNPTLSQTVQGNTYGNSIGLTAGFDKPYEIPRALERLGFGALELNDITPRPQSDDPQPRMFRLLEDDASMDRMGFNNIGMSKALSHLRKNAYQVPAGINVGASKMTPYEARYQDHIRVTDTFKYDVSFLIVNVSSPNTENPRNFHDRDESSMLCQASITSKKQHDAIVPVYLKLTFDMDLDGLEALLPAITEIFGGIILANTMR